MNLLLAGLLFAQVAGWQPYAYTTSDPVDPTRLGLATSDGRYSITVNDAACAGGMTENQNVQVLGSIYGGWNLVLIPVGSDGPSCLIFVESKQSDVPCFANTDGVCDVTEEFDQ